MTIPCLCLLKYCHFDKSLVGRVCRKQKLDNKQINKVIRQLLESDQCIEECKEEAQ